MELPQWRHNGFDVGGRSVPGFDGSPEECGLRSQFHGQRSATIGSVDSAIDAALQYASIVIGRLVNHVFLNQFRRNN